MALAGSHFIAYLEDEGSSWLPPSSQGHIPEAYQMAISVAEIGGKGYCPFPEYLWRPLADGSVRKWTSKTEYEHNTDRWVRQKEIIVREKEIEMKYKVHASCTDKEDNSGVPCFKKDIVYKVICVSEEPGQKFRVMQTGNGAVSFTCIKFVQRNKNIISVFSAVPNNQNEDRLCFDESLQREEWPWIAPVQDEWSPCPMVGGFDFRTHEGERKKMLCNKIWRPSRMESECIYGEGVDFIFPEEECSPFHHKSHGLNLQCWGSWQEEDYMFAVMAHPHKQPQYVLRFPNAYAQPHFVAHLYFSPVCPLSGQGEPPGKVLHAELRMKPSDSALCFDESERCQEFAREGKCTSSGLHRVANFCKKSCGLCRESKPSVRAECVFPEEYQGDWMLFEAKSKETVSIKSGSIKFSHLGEFTCKTKHWSANKYKLLSTFENGCRPRYTCLHFQLFSADHDNILQYQISRSKHTDEGFQMCVFHDDPSPIGDFIRSSNMKLLLAKSHVAWGNCELGGAVHVNATFPDGRSCDGTLTDWNTRTCNIRSKLTLSFTDPMKCHNPTKLEFLCIARINVDSSSTILITQDQISNKKYMCWAITTHSDQLYHRPWTLAYEVPTSMCGTALASLNSMEPHQAKFTIQAYNDQIQTICQKSNDGFRGEEEEEKEEVMDNHHEDGYGYNSKAHNSFPTMRTYSPYQPPKTTKPVRTHKQEYTWSEDGGSGTKSTIFYPNNWFLRIIVFCFIGFLPDFLNKLR